MLAALGRLARPPRPSLPATLVPSLLLFRKQAGLEVLRQFLQVAHDVAQRAAVLLRPASPTLLAHPQALSSPSTRLPATSCLWPKLSFLAALRPVLQAAHGVPR